MWNVKHVTKLRLWLNSNDDDLLRHNVLDFSRNLAQGVGLESKTGRHCIFSQVDHKLGAQYFRLLHCYLLQEEG